MSLEIPPVLEAPIFLLDYDGTLAPIQQEPMQAFPHDQAIPLLRRLNQLFPLWIITGRHLNDLKVLLDVELHAIGLHGLQEGVIGSAVHTSLGESTQDDIRRMRALLPDIDEARVEDKEYTFAVHYRGAVQEGAVIEKLKSWLQHLPPSLDAIWGKKVVELKPKGISKGSAVKEIIKGFPGHVPVYIGDDTTDEAAFRVLRQLEIQRVLTIKVGSGPTHAEYRLPGVDAVIEYLKQYTDR